MRKLGLLLVFGMFASAAWAGFTPGNWTNVDSYHGQGDPLNVVLTYNYAGPDFTIGTFDWAGDGEAFSPSYASEARCWITAPSGENAGFQLASGYAGVFTSGGSDAFFNGVQALGTWTFEFYESYDDGSVDPDATHYNIQFTFNDDYTPPPQYVWFEDFNAGIPGAWTITDNLGNSPFVWTTNDVAGRTNYAGGDGLCADADADAFGSSGVPYDTSLISPSFEVPADGTLEFDAAYNDLTAGGNDIAEVNILTATGSTNLIYWDEDHDAYGPGEHVSVDLSPYAGQQAQIEFRYYGGGWDWYFEVDNVGVIPEPASLALLAFGGLALLRRR